jgi:hypothetical protein
VSEKIQRHLQDRSEWQKAFDELLKFGSEGVLKEEILQARKIFFSRLGSAHEMKEDVFETTSQSFLEWYLFDYQTWRFSKSPAVVFTTLELGSRKVKEWIRRALFEVWSLYEVFDLRANEILFKDLLFGGSKTILRRALYDQDSPDSKLWKVKKGQVVQVRLFESSQSPWYFFSHLWIHPDREIEHLKSICSNQRQRWSRYKTLLLECFEAVVRSHGLQRQLHAANAPNWLYQELTKKYA